ncbi:MAG: hypothetical protein ACETWT_10125 [Thermodesulfobacteriota bacterium]
MGIKDITTGATTIIGTTATDTITDTPTVTSITFDPTIETIVTGEDTIATVTAITKAGSRRCSLGWRESLGFFSPRLRRVLFFEISQRKVEKFGPRHDS